MRNIQFVLAALLGLAATPALAQVPAQVPAGIDPATGARPGHVPGVGESLPRSSKASNILGGGASSDVAPTLPSPALGAAASPADYLRAARIALVAGQTGEAQQSLEMAETRSLDRAMAPGQDAGASDSRVVAGIRDALGALGNGDSAGAIAVIDRVLAG